MPNPKSTRRTVFSCPTQNPPTPVAVTGYLDILAAAVEAYHPHSDPKPAMLRAIAPALVAAFADVLATANSLAIAVAAGPLVDDVAPGPIVDAVGRLLAVAVAAGLLVAALGAGQQAVLVASGPPVDV
ncbi:hypothetical protein Droror1_Dr00022377 [Drosera rotundifolia]